MKHFTFTLVGVATMALLVAVLAPARGHATGESAPYITEIPQGYRDWRWISSAHEAGNLNSLGAVLGNDVAIKAYRDGKLPYPDGTIIAALHYRNVPSDENNKVFGQAQSFVPGPPTNIQFMVKDSTPWLVLNRHYTHNPAGSLGGLGGVVVGVNICLQQLGAHSQQRFTPKGQV